MKSDIKLQKDVEEELRWDPKINAAQIGVIVNKGVVSLRGTVDTYAEKCAAEDATKRVSGVRTVAQDLEVQLLTEDRRGDPDIALAVQNALGWDVFVPSAVRATVSRGHVTLEGQVAWNYERDSAETAVRYLTGVTGVTDLITLKTQLSNEKVKEKVQAALLRQATEDANSIKIETAGGRVTLTGHASSWKSSADASAAAWAAPGVTEVVDRIHIQ